MKALQRKTVGFIGAGTMGQALMRGLIARGLRPRALIASDPRGAMRRRVGRLRVRTTASNCEIACEADLIILAVKPQEVFSVLEEVGECVHKRQLVISIAAGVTRAALQARLPGMPLVRVMPNLPATVGQGFAAYALGRYASARHRAMIETVFNAVGVSVELPERLLDAVTAVSGSGPAYLFYLAQVLEEAGRRLGLPRRVAEQAVRHTLLGGATLLVGEDTSAEAWMRRVASKRGTTEAALRHFARRGVKGHLIEGVRAAARRSKELSCRFC